MTREDRGEDALVETSGVVVDEALRRLAVHGRVALGGVRLQRRAVLPELRRSEGRTVREPCPPDSVRRARTPAVGRGFLFRRAGHGRWSGLRRVDRAHGQFPGLTRMAPAARMSASPIQVPGAGCLVPGANGCQVPGAAVHGAGCLVRELASAGTWHLIAPGTSALGTRHPFAPGTWHEAPGTSEFRCYQMTRTAPEARMSASRVRSGSASVRAAATTSASNGSRVNRSSSAT